MNPEMPDSLPLVIDPLGSREQDHGVAMERRRHDGVEVIAAEVYEWLRTAARELENIQHQTKAGL